MVIVAFSHCHVQVQLCNNELLCIQDSVACAYVSQLSPPMTGKLYRKTAVRPPTNQRRASPRDVIAILIADSRDSTRPINVSCLHCVFVSRWFPQNWGILHEELDSLFQVNYAQSSTCIILYKDSRIDFYNLLVLKEKFQKFNKPFHFNFLNDRACAPINWLSNKKYSNVKNYIKVIILYLIF